MPHTIVCGVDDSDTAARVADTARWLADGLDARLLLLQVAVEPGEKEIDLPPLVRARVVLGEEDEVRLVDGSPSQRLLATVSEDGAELLVVGTRGRGSIRSAVFGSVSRTLATEATCPVVVLPPQAWPPARDDDGNASIVCGVDGSDHSLSAAKVAADFAVRMGFRLILMHALAGLDSYLAYPGARETAPGPSAQPDTRERLARDIVDAAVAAVGGNAVGMVEAGLPWDALESVASREDGRLLVIAARGLSAARAAAFGSVLTNLATSARLPVVILPEPAAAA